KDGTVLILQGLALPGAISRAVVSACFVHNLLLRGCSAKKVRLGSCENLQSRVRAGGAFPASFLRPLVRSAPKRAGNGRKAMSSRGASTSKRTIRLASHLCGLFACTAPFAAQAGTVANPICPQETAFFSPGARLSINVPQGYNISMFAAGLNFPTGLAFLRRGQGFEVYVLESGHGLPSRCNEQDSPAVGGPFSSTNPFTPDILVFDQRGTLLRKIAKPTAPGVGFQTAGPAVDIGFEHGFAGGRLFATDSNQATHAAGQNNSSRIVM